MGTYVVMVEFRVKPGALAAFRKLMDDNARASARLEPGCRRFDVIEPEGDENRVLLYEIYADRAAFEAHKRTSHFLGFDTDSASLVLDKTVTTGTLVCEGSA